jgi:hypothetical protein
MLCPQLESTFEKSCHGSIPANTIAAYDVPWSGFNPTSLPKTKVIKITAVSGCKTAQSTPSTVCL